MRVSKEAKGEKGFAFFGSWADNGPKSEMEGKKCTAQKDTDGKEEEEA